MHVIKYLALFMVFSSAAVADQIQFKVVDIVWSQDTSRGGGVEIIYQFNSKPNDGEDAIEAFALSECNRIAPKYVPIVLEKVGQPEAAFVAMNLRFGGTFGTYAKYFMDYDAGVCSATE